MHLGKSTSEYVKPSRLFRMTTYNLAVQVNMRLLFSDCFVVSVDICGCMNELPPGDTAGFLSDGHAESFDIYI
jgi:hypothetical protein